VTHDEFAARLPGLRAAAARCSRVPDEAEDLLQDALLEAVRAGRADLTQAANHRWLLGTLRNLGAMSARGAARRRLREQAWMSAADAAATPAVASTWPPSEALAARLETLPPALRQVADLALAGHDRREIAWLLRLGDATLRQRIAALRRRLAGFAPEPDAGASCEELTLPLGLIRRALLPVVIAREGVGAHDPDGHLLVFSPSQPARP
jgi:RNA polymerase sigma-70 factor (ECF subfamily)